LLCPRVSGRRLLGCAVLAAWASVGGPGPTGVRCVSVRARWRASRAGPGPWELPWAVFSQSASEPFGPSVGTTASCGSTRCTEHYIVVPHSSFTSPTFRIMFQPFSCYKWRVIGLSEQQVRNSLLREILFPVPLRFFESSSEGAISYACLTFVL
jgi:hypothetical protein